MANNNGDGIVLIHGRQYQTVALRVQMFREKHPMFTLITEPIQRDEACVVMKASILDETGRIIATGHAEEYRSSSQINKTSALENAETSAIGRALAAFGLGGTEFASADEVAHVVSGGKPGVHKPSDGSRERCSPARRKVIEDTAILVIDALREDRDFDAFGLCEGFEDPDEKVYLWTFLDSKQRARLKGQAEVAKKTKAAEWKKEVGATA
jgi:hypothetical protein